MELLSKQYEITFLGPGHTVELFKKYSFLKRVLPGCNFGDSSAKLPLITQQAIKNIIKEGNWTYTYHHDDDTNFLVNHPEILSLKRYPVLHDKEININSNTWNSNFFISRTKKYMLKLQLMLLEDTVKYDCTVRCPTIVSAHKGNTIVVYEGSRESLRKLPIQTIEKFIKILPDAVYLVTQETAQILKLNEKNIKFLLTSPYTEKSLENIIQLFEKQPKVMIGPDSGLTQLASAYKILLIWLQSRIVLENVIDSGYKKNCKVYLKTELTCKRDCLGCIATKVLKTNTLPYGLFEIKEKRTNHKDLDCFKAAIPNCLQYTEQEVEEIIKLIN
jgi:hypothetical protein